MTIQELFLLIWSWVTSKRDQLSEEEYLNKQNEIHSQLKELGKKMLSITLRIAVIAIFVIAVVWIILLCYHKNPLVTIIFIGIALLIVFGALSSNNKPSEMNTSTPNPNADALYQNAVNGYPHMRTIMFQTLRQSAVDIGGDIPRAPQEIEVMTDKFVINANTGIIYYQFRLAKQDIKNIYTDNDLVEFNGILQNTFSNLWQAGKFSQLSLQSHIDQYGNVFNPVIVDRIDDLGNEYLIQTVFTTPAYAELVHMYWENQRASQDIGYNSNDSRFL